MSTTHTQTINVMSMVNAYGDIDVPIGLSREELRNFVRKAYEEGALTLSIDWGTEHDVEISAWHDPATGETSDIPLYGNDPSAALGNGVRVLVREQVSRFGSIELERDTPLDEIPKMVADAITNDQVLFEDCLDDEFQIVHAKLDEQVLIEDLALT